MVPGRQAGDLQLHSKEWYGDPYMLPPAVHFPPYPDRYLLAVKANPWLFVPTEQGDEGWVSLKTGVVTWAGAK